MSRHVDEALWGYARGELDAEARADVDAHLALCADCAAKAQQAKAAQALLSAVAVPKPGREFWERVDERVLSALPAKRPGLIARVFEPLWVRGLAAAAAAALLALGASLWVQRPSEEVAQIAWAGEARTRALSDDGWVVTGARTAVTHLPEGSRIELAEGTRAQFAAASKEEVRLSLERGRVLVDASHVEGRPFVVATSDVEVIVVGTRFLVAKEGGGTVVEVFEGKVEVRRGAEVLGISAGEKARVGDGELRLVDPVERPAANAQVEAQPPPVQAAPEVVAPKIARVEPKAAPPPPAPEHSTVAKLGDEEPPPPAPSPLTPPPIVSLEAADAGIAPSTPTREGPQPWASTLFGGLKNWKKWTKVDWLSDVVPPGADEREYRARQLVFLADDGRCEAVAHRAERWLRLYEQDATRTAEGQELLSGVRFTYARCLEKLGQHEKAAALRAQ